ncbi:MAG: UPF0489 family protein [Elusimicrobia bacterium]|nr:UPF0489 family protein [Elusimicrobiota bacterium]
MPEVRLVIPPDYEYDAPPLGTPALAGFLKSRGIGVSQLDLNLAYRDSWDGSADTARRRMNELFDGKAQGLYYSSLLPQNAGDYQYGSPYDNRTNSSFYFIERILSSGILFRYLDDEDENTFLRFFLADPGAKGILSGTPSLIGLSIVSPSQALAGLTLCRLLKRRSPEVKIALGGQWATLFAEEIMARPDWAALFDFVVTGEGETPLLGLVSALESRGPVSTVPNLIRHANGAWIRSPVTSEEDLDLLPTPDFEGLPLASYASSRQGGLALTCETSRGCYWNRCAYCVDLPLPKPSYRAKSPDLVARDFKALAERHKPALLLVSNATMSPSQMREVSTRLIQEDFAVPWWTMARLDNGFTRDIFDLAREAGCKQVNFGFESASDRVCGLVLKGNKQAVSERVIRDCHAAGVAVGLQTIFGLPGETVEEGLETVAFISENRASIDHPAFNTYYLTPKCPVYDDPARWGLEFDRDGGLPFKFFTEFRQARGPMSPMEAGRLEQLCKGLMHRRSTHLVEDHNEVLGVWRKLGLSGLPLIHLDAHIDFGWVPEKDITQILEAGTKAELDSLLASRPLWNPVETPKERLVTIGNFVCPAMQDGIVSEFYWVVPDGTLSSHKERRHVLRTLKRLARPRTLVRAQGDLLVTELAGRKTIVCELAGLPKFPGPVLLDIDLDYLLTRKVTDDLAPDREPWIAPERLSQRLAGLGLKPECTTISYSVEGGFTPLRFKHLGDELKARLQSSDWSVPPAARHYLAALAGLEKGEIDSARLSYRKAVGLDPSYRTAYNNPGPVLEFMDDRAGAEKAYKDALKLDPANALALCGLGNVNRARKDWTEAERLFRKALELSPAIEDAHFGLGAVLLASGGSPEEAASHFRAVLDLSPDSAGAFFQLGLIAERQGKAGEALSHFRKARRLGLDSADLHWRLGRGLLAERRYGKAGRELYRAAATALDAMVSR